MTITTWDYEGFWNVVIGRSAARCVAEFDLAGDRAAVAAWVDEAAAQAWQAGGQGGRMPEEWAGFIERAADALVIAAQADAIVVVNVGPSTTVPLDEYPGAVDADVTVGGIEGEVTLIPREQDGVLDMWGPGLDCWASPSLHDLPADVLQEVVAHVRHDAAADPWAPTSTPTTRCAVPETAQGSTCAADRPA